MKKPYGIDCIRPEIIKTITKRAMDMHEEFTTKLEAGELSSDHIPVVVSRMQKDAFRRMWDQGSSAVAEYVITSLMAEMFMGLGSTSLVFNPLSNASSQVDDGVIDQIRQSPGGIRDFLSDEEKALSQSCHNQFRSLEAVLAVIAGLVGDDDEQEDTGTDADLDTVVVDFATAKKDRGILH